MQLFENVKTESKKLDFQRMKSIESINTYQNRIVAKNVPPEHSG